MGRQGVWVVGAMGGLREESVTGEVEGNFGIRSWEEWEEGE